MEPGTAPQVEVVDPEVRAYVYSLITALGGSGGSDTGQYVLGDDALACLRDIKKWLRFYDEKANRMDVARCLAEAELVNRDLLPILALCGDSVENDKHKLRISLACLELLVPLTWPLEIQQEMTANHHRHTPYLRQAQVMYKRGILGHTTAAILRTIIRIVLPSMTIPRSERSSRDEGIIKLMLYLLRNVVIITQLPQLAVEGDDEEASRSATINAFHDQDVFALLLTMCSNVGDSFNTQDVVILEILFHLVKGVDVKKLFMGDTERTDTTNSELKDLLDKEAFMEREQAKTAPTRHGRFGTMIWVKREDEKFSTVTGQDVLRDNKATFLKMDKTKKWNKPRTGKGNPDVSINNFSLPASLTSSASKHLREFTEEFLDSGFNPLFIHLRKAIEREAERVTEATPRHFFYVVSWFLEAERIRRARQQEARKRNKDAPPETEPDSYSIVAGVLNQETFIALNRQMQNNLDYKEWQDLHATMRCFTQILLTVQEMTGSPLEEDQEIAENIQSRIFYEETTHDRILAILRGYKDQGLGYLDACTELSHVFLRMLEHYSKQNADMQIRSRRRARRKRAKEASQNQQNAEQDNENESEAEDAEEAAQVVRERSFDFKRFAAKFCTQKSVDTFVALAAFYRELNHEQLKRVHRFFYRVAFKQDLSVLLFRTDIIALFYRMVKGPEGLDPTNPIFRDWEEFVRHILRKLIKKIEQRPELIVEMLFSKINSTVYYLEYGHEKQTLSESRPAADLEVKPNAASTMDGRLKIVVSALVLDGKADLVRWLCGVLESGFNERKSWELETEARKDTPEGEAQEPAPSPPSIAVPPADEACRLAMFRNSRLRLLMTLAGLQMLGTEDVLGASWIIPSSIPSSSLEERQKMIQQHCDHPAAEIDDVDPRDLLRRKSAARSAADAMDVDPQLDFGNDSEGEENADIDGALFPANIRAKRSSAIDELKRKRRKRRKSDDGEGHTELDEETLEARRLAREQNAMARQRKIKSDLYVNASDDETDEEADKEFFAREEERRKDQAERIKHALLTGTVPEPGAAKGKKKVAQKRKSNGASSEMTKRKRRKSEDDNISLGSDNDDNDLMLDGESSAGPSDTEMPSRHVTPPTSTEDGLGHGLRDESPDDPFVWTTGPANTDPKSANGNNGPNKGENQTALDDEDEDIMPMPSRRPRVMAGFVIDSDSE